MKSALEELHFTEWWGRTTSMEAHNQNTTSYYSKWLHKHLCTHIMTSNFLDKRDGCVCDKKQTNAGWIATNLADEEMIGLNWGQPTEIGSCRVFLEKAVSGWNAQETCHPVLSRFSSQCSAHFLLWYLSKAFSSDTGQCLSSMLVSKHRRFSQEKPNNENIVNGGCCFFYLYAASLRRISCTEHERPSGHPKADLTNGLKLNRILMSHPHTS